jgi:uncharacterized repeat protein (TIGR03803 family)
MFAGAVAALSQVAYQRLIDLGPGSPTGQNPLASLVEGPDGVLYGTTYNYGTVYRLKKDGTAFRVLARVLSLYADVVVSPDGALYGVSAGAADLFFTVNRDSTGFRSLLTFPPIPNGGSSPQSYLLSGDDGAFYSTTRVGGSRNAGVIFKVNPDGTGYTVLYEFGSTPGDGGDVRAGLIKGSDGVLYGVTFGGTIFRLNQDGGGFSVLHSFEGAASGDGSGAHARLLEGNDGALYGTTRFGGIPGPDGGYGTIFRINKDGSDYAVLHRFDPTAGDGAFPYSHLVEGTNGSLYGTGWGGGTNAGTLFRIDKSGSGFAVLHRFGVVAGDGRFPHCGLLIGTDGVFYGTTQDGGEFEDGTVYRIEQGGTGYRVLVSFLPEQVRQTPRTPVLLGSDGRLYCVTEDTGSTNFGSIFSIGRDGTDFQLLHGFGVTTNDGRIPNGLLEASDGLLYGTTQSGGTNNGGTLYKISKEGTNYAVLRSFIQAAEGAGPKSPVLEGSDGWLYGTANVGGS